MLNEMCINAKLYMQDKVHWVCMPAGEPTDTLDMKALRADHPSGWLLLTKSETVPFVIDALLEAEPGREFNQSQLAKAAGVHRNSLSKYLDLLLKLRVLEAVPDSRPTRYRVNTEGPVTKELFHLNSAVNSIGFDTDPGLDEVEIGGPVQPFETVVDQGSGSERTPVRPSELGEG